MSKPNKNPWGHSVWIAALWAASLFAAVSSLSCDGGESGGSSDAAIDATAAKRGKDKTDSGGPDASGAAGAAGTSGRACTTSKRCGQGSCSTADIEAPSLSEMLKTYNGTLCFEACCTIDGKCGSKPWISAYIQGIGVYHLLNVSKCIERDQPGAESASCPGLFESLATGYDAGYEWRLDAAIDTELSAPIFVKEIDFQGCCRSDGFCGFLAASFGFGCASTADIQALLSFGDSILAPRACIP